MFRSGIIFFVQTLFIVSFTKIIFTVRRRDNPIGLKQIVTCIFNHMGYLRRKRDRIPVTDIVDVPAVNQLAGPVNHNSQLPAKVAVILIAPLLSGFKLKKKGGKRVVAFGLAEPAQGFIFNPLRW